MLIVIFNENVTNILNGWCYGKTVNSWGEKDYALKVTLILCVMNFNCRQCMPWRCCETVVSSLASGTRCLSLLVTVWRACLLALLSSLSLGSLPTRLGWASMKWQKEVGIISYFIVKCCPMLLCYSVKWLSRHYLLQYATLSCIKVIDLQFMTNADGNTSQLIVFGVA